MSLKGKGISNSMMDMIKKWTVGPNLNVQNDRNHSFIKHDSKNCSNKIALPNIKSPSKRKKSSPEMKRNGHIDVQDSPPCKKVKESRNSNLKNNFDISNATKIYPNSNDLSSVKRGSRSTKYLMSKVPESPLSLRQSRNSKLKDFIKLLDTKDSESKSPSPKKKQSKTARKNIFSKSSKNNSPPKSTKKKSKSIENKELNSIRLCTSNKISKTESEGMPKENHFDIRTETKSILHPKENVLEKGPNFFDDEQDPNTSLNTTNMQSQSTLPYKNSIPKNSLNFSSECSSAIKVQNTSINTSSLQIQGAPINYENSNTYLSTVPTLQPNLLGINYSNPSSLMLQPLSNAANSIVPVNNTLSVNNLHHSVAPNLPSTIMVLQPFDSASLVIIKCNMPLEDCLNIARRIFSGVEVLSIINNSDS